MIDESVFKGSIQLHAGDREAIFEVASLGKTYVEIGTFWGASACIAGLAGCEVYCIDPFRDYADEYLPGPTPEDVMHNWIAQGLDPDRLHIYPYYHPPWPVEIDRKFDVGLIDGDHSWEAVNEDFTGMAHRVKYLMFHDTNQGSVKSVFKGALNWSSWEEYIPETKEKSVLSVLKRSGT